MTLATLRGRLQTKLSTYVLLGVVTTGFVWMGGPVYLWALSATVVVGLALESLWGLFVTYQPGWVTFVFGGIEFFAVVGVVTVLGAPMTLGAALLYYVTCWSVIQLFLLYVLPVWRLSWSEDGGELW